MAYVSNNKNYKIVKKEVGIHDGNKIYKDLLEVVCKECGNKYYHNISINENNNVNLKCHYCKNY